MSVLEVKNVSIRYITGDFKDIGLKEYTMKKLKGEYHVTEFWADRNISFALEKGEMLGIIGTNGAGKSTLLKAVSGIMEPTKGSVKRKGNIAALLELASGFDGDLTVKENAYLRGAMLGYTRKFMDEMYNQIIEFAELRNFQDRPFKQLSSGMKSRLAFSIASLVQPDILILDEVLSVGDGAFRKKSEAKMREIISNGAATILVSHSVEQVQELCTKVLWLDHGQQIALSDDVQGICDLYQKFLNKEISLEEAERLAHHEGRKTLGKVGHSKGRIQNFDVALKLVNREADALKGTLYKFQVMIFAAFLLILLGSILLFCKSAFAIAYWIMLLMALFLFPKGKLKKIVFSALKDWWKLDRQETLNLIKLVSTATLLFSIATHGFLFTNEFFSHDSITNSYSMWRTTFWIEIGRMLIPLYELMKGNVTAPWMVGLLYIFWMVPTNMLVVRLLNLKNKICIVLACGLFSTNTAMTLFGATYITWLDDNAFSILAAVAAAYLFCQCEHGLPLGILCVIISASIYQAYFTITVALCFFAVIQKVISNEKIETVIIQGVKYVADLLCGFGAYFMVWKVVCKIFSVNMSRFSDTALLGGFSKWIDLIVKANGSYMRILFDRNGVFGEFRVIINITLLMLLGVWLIGRLINKELSFENKILLVALVLLFPTVFNSAQILFLESASGLTLIAQELIYIFLISCLEWGKSSFIDTDRKKQHQLIICVMMSFLVFQNVVFANQAYMKKDLEKSSTLVLAARIIERIEQTDGYVPGKTPVALVGQIRYNPYLSGKREGFEEFFDKTGLNYSYAATYNFRQYITQYLDYPISWASSGEISKLEHVKEMPIFPDREAIQNVEGTVVVKLS